MSKDKILTHWDLRGDSIGSAYENGYGLGLIYASKNWEILHSLFRQWNLTSIALCIPTPLLNYYKELLTVYNTPYLSKKLWDSL